MGAWWLFESIMPALLAVQVGSAAMKTPGIATLADRRTVFVGGFGAGVTADGNVDGVVVEAGNARPPRHLLVHVAAAGQVRPDGSHNRVRSAKVLHARLTT